MLEVSFCMEQRAFERQFLDDLLKFDQRGVPLSSRRSVSVLGAHHGGISHHASNDTLGLIVTQSQRAVGEGAAGF